MMSSGFDHYRSWSLQILCRRVIRIQWSSDYDDTKIWLELAAGGWPVGQDMWILTSQPGNWNGWIFCTHGDGVTVVLYTYFHTPPHQCPPSTSFWQHISTMNIHPECNVTYLFLTQCLNPEHLQWFCRFHFALQLSTEEKGLRCKFYFISHRKTLAIFLANMWSTLV